jgi:butyrate kinase
MTGKFKVAASTTFYLMVNEVLNQVGKEVGFTKKLLKGKKYRFAVAGGICTSKDVTDPLNESERQAIYMHYKRVLII